MIHVNIKASMNHVNKNVQKELYISFKVSGHNAKAE